VKLTYAGGLSGGCLGAYNAYGTIGFVLGSGFTWPISASVVVARQLDRK
jgi:hypothetical protein